MNCKEFYNFLSIFVLIIFSIIILCNIFNYNFGQINYFSGKYTYGESTELDLNRKPSEGQFFNIRYNDEVGKVLVPDVSLLKQYKHY